MMVSPSILSLDGGGSAAVDEETMHPRFDPVGGGEVF
jgi:hypothetical protein